LFEVTRLQLPVLARLLAATSENSPAARQRIDWLTACVRGVFSVGGRDVDWTQLRSSGLLARVLALTNPAVPGGVDEALCAAAPDAHTFESARLVFDDTILEFLLRIPVKQEKTSVALFLRLLRALSEHLLEVYGRFMWSSCCVHRSRPSSRRSQSPRRNA
jgi:hypothetical protein